MRRPRPRGPLGRLLLETITATPTDGSALLPAAGEAVASARARGGVLADEDVQLTLTAMYELHYRGLDGVHDAWEWDGGLLAARGVLEAAVEVELRALVAEHVRPPAPGADSTSDLVARLVELTERDLGPQLSRHLERRATPEQWREFLTHRSVYHLKEADPHTWAIPRLAGRAKAALVEIQADEYGGGRAEYMHSALFARTLREVGLDDTYGAAVDDVPAVTLASVNAMSLLGLHRRLRGAAVGHLAAYETTSSTPNRRYGNGLRRLGLGPAATGFFDEHVEADAVHEQIALHDLVGALVAQEPHLAADVLFGAAVALVLDARVATHMLDRWSAGESSLRTVPAGAAA